ncbi:hypothetical protein HK100_006578, partial [Physocladia obscura]
YQVNCPSDTTDFATAQKYETDNCNAAAEFAPTGTTTIWVVQQQTLTSFVGGAASTTSKTTTKGGQASKANKNLKSYFVLAIGAAGFTSLEAWICGNILWGHVAINHENKGRRTKKKQLRMSSESKQVAELQERLAEALEAMAEKERDLIMAAEFGQSLVAANTRLQQQLAEVSAGGGIAGGDDGEQTEKTAERQIQALTRQTQTLTQDLRTALLDHKRSEAEHAKQVRLLEADLDSLAAQLASASKEKEKEKDKEPPSDAPSAAAKEAKDPAESAESARENASLLQIDLLKAEVDRLAVAKKDVDKALHATSAALQESVVRLHDQEDRLQAAQAMRQEFERRGVLIVQLKEQIEDLRAQLDERAEADQLEGFTQNNSAANAAGDRLKINDNWEWTPWLESVKHKAWERNITGLREEVEDLRRHREEAYNKLKAEMDGYMAKFVGALPESVLAVAQAVGVPIATGLGQVPELLSNANNALGPKVSVEQKVETVAAVFPNVPRDAIERDLSATRSVRLTIENILSGFVSPSAAGNTASASEKTADDLAGSGLEFSVANPEEEVEEGEEE